MNTIYGRIFEQVETLLKQGVIPWQQPWDPKVGAPRNGISGRFYRGLNVFLLHLAGYESPYWFTPRQVNALDAHIRKGERISWIHFWKPWQPKVEAVDSEEEQETTRKRKRRLIVRAYRVVNLEQCEGPGIEKFREKHQSSEGENFEPLRACEEIVENMPEPPAIRYGGSEACYASVADQVQMPPRNSFVSAVEHYATLFHELVHSTGHPKRLDRATVYEAAPFGSPTYSREELVAEMGAAFLCATAGISDPTLRNSVGYIEHWLNFLREDPKALVVAGAQAQKAADYITGSAGVEEVEMETVEDEV